MVSRRDILKGLRGAASSAARGRLLLWGVGGALLFAAGCTGRAWPDCAAAVPERAQLDPDYTDLTIPPNIAPLVCGIGNAGDAFRFRLASSDGSLSYRGSGQTVAPPLGVWRKILEASRGGPVTLDLCVRRKGEWVKLVTVTNRVAQESVDPALVYRRIPPSYERFNELSLRQRDLTSFKERTLYANSQVSREQCVNCHTFKNNDGRYFAFHARQHRDGTLIFDGAAPAKKVSLKCDALCSGAAYPAWHPTDGNLFAFSVNKTRQVSYITYAGKIEVLDSQSGLVLYDAEKNEVSPIQLDDNLIATYPEWSPDGKTLYYTAAETSGLPPASDETNRFEAVFVQSTNLFYHLVSRSFDPTAKTFGAPQLLVNGVQSKASIAFPRVSPDGAYLMLTVLGFANFPIWHPESDLWLYNIRTREARALAEVNSPDADSYHAWGSNGRWFVFGSRRDDGIHTRPFLAYFDPATGRAGKPFLVPQKDPSFYRRNFMSFNRPELLKVPVPYSAEEIRQAMLQPAQQAGFRRGSP